MDAQFDEISADCRFPAWAVWKFANVCSRRELRDGETIAVVTLSPHTSVASQGIQNLSVYRRAYNLTMY